MKIIDKAVLAAIIIVALAAPVPIAWSGEEAPLASQDETGKMDTPAAAPKTEAKTETAERPASEQATEPTGQVVFTPAPTTETEPAPQIASQITQQSEPSLLYEPEPETGALDDFKSGAVKTGHAIKEGSIKAAEAVKEGAIKTGEAAKRGYGKVVDFFSGEE